MKKHMIIKGVAVMVLSSTFGVCQARDGSVMVDTARPTTDVFPRRGGRTPPPPLVPAARQDVIMQDMTFDGTSKSRGQWEQVITVTADRQKGEVDEILSHVRVLCRNGMIDSILGMVRTP